jgi:hypothetical protein
MSESMGMDYGLEWDSILTTLMWTLVFTIGVVVRHSRWRRLYQTERELSVEKEALESLLGMMCDAGIWIAADCDTILRSHKQLDALIGTSMQGKRLAAYLDEPQRLQLALVGGTAGTRSSAQLISSTLVGGQGNPIRVELFIVDRRAAFASHGDNMAESPTRLGFLIGLRLVDQDFSGQNDFVAYDTVTQKLVDQPMSTQSRGSLASEELVSPQGVPRSYRSAPALLEYTKVVELVSGAQRCPAGGGDCLPLDAAVWVESKSTPAKLGSIQMGQKVLCYDHLSQGLKYAEVMEAVGRGTEGESEAVDWIAVTLTDGSRLEMTRDHPVFPWSTSVEPGVDDTMMAAVKAGDLKVQSHSLEILKVVPVPVKSIERLPPKVVGGRGPERVTISVQQPERHSLFVMPGNEPSHRSCGMALGSSCVASVPRAAWRLASPWSELPQGITIKNTFIDVSSGGEGSGERSRSEPPGLRIRRSSLSGCRCTVLSDECLSEHAGSLSSAASTGRSDVSPTSNGGCEVFVGLDISHGGGPFDTPPLARTASLIELQELWDKGCQSFGSRGHAQGECWPCVMEHRHNHSDAGDRRTKCKFGALCGRCHELHSRPQLNSAQKRVRRFCVR